MQTSLPTLLAIPIVTLVMASCSDSGVQRPDGSGGALFPGTSGTDMGGSSNTGGRTNPGNTTGGSGNASGGSNGGNLGRCSGYATRFFDCCKPHCGWRDNVQGGSPMKTCNASDSLLNNPDEQSSCNGGNAHVCHDMAPWAVSSNLAYGFVATNPSEANGDICGRCYQLDFTGTGHYGSNPGAAALAGKTMIVQAINIGGDVGSGQFDLMIPGGGVGQFNACSSQWGVSTSELGAQYGGFLTTCQEQLGYNAGLEDYKECVAQRCQSVFGTRGLSELQEGCEWFVDWFEAADNPNLNYKEVTCPSALTNLSGLSGRTVSGSCR